MTGAGGSLTGASGVVAGSTAPPAVRWYRPAPAACTSVVTMNPPPLTLVVALVTVCAGPSSEHFPAHEPEGVLTTAIAAPSAVQDAQASGAWAAVAVLVRTGCGGSERARCV